MILPVWSASVAEMANPKFLMPCESNLMADSAELISLRPIDYQAAWLDPSSVGGPHGLDASS
jgi:hypothetical protein